MNEKTEFLSDLDIGTSACVANADRLIRDAEQLFHEQRYLSSFFLSELAREEIGKGFQLLKWISHQRKVSKDNWKTLIKGKNAHVNKLKIVQEADDKWLADVTKGLGISHAEIQRGILSQMPSVKNIDEYRDARAKESFDLRMFTTYVDYDFQEKEWQNPTTLPISSDLNFWIQRLTLTKHLIGILRAKMNEASKKPHA